MVDAIQSLLIHVGAVNCGDQNFLGLWPWYHYLSFAPDATGVCQAPNTLQILGTHSALLLILLVVVDDLLRIIGLLAVLYVIYAGIKYTMSRGSPDETAKSQTTIINALGGLAISLVAVRFVAFLGNQFSNGTGGSSNATGLSLTSLPNPIGIANGGIIPTMLTIVFSIAGALSFVFLILGGYNYISSQGDPQRVGKAKSTVMYALVGLVVTIAAQSIVSFVVSKI